MAIIESDQLALHLYKSWADQKDRALRASIKAGDRTAHTPQPSWYALRDDERELFYAMSRDLKNAGLVLKEPA